MPIIAALVLAGCIALTLMILRGRQAKPEVEYEVERNPELDEALERMRAWVRRPAAVIAAATIVELALIAALVRNPSRWAVMLLALAVVGAAATGFLLTQRRRRRQDL